jgi:hypothetical protein
LLRLEIVRRFRVAKSKVDSLPPEAKTNFLRYSTSEENGFYLVPFLYIQDIKLETVSYELTLVRKNKNNKVYTKTLSVESLPTDSRIKVGRFWWNWSEKTIYSNPIKSFGVVSIGEKLIPGHRYSNNTLITEVKELAYNQIPAEVLEHNNLLRKLIGYQSFCGQLHDTVVTLHATTDPKHDYFQWELSTDKFVYGRRNKLAEIIKLFPGDYKEIVEFDKNGKYVSHETILLKKEYREDVENFSIVELEHRKYTPEKHTGLDYSGYEEKEDYIQFSETILGAEAIFDRL